jgi:hypothetical protein
VGTHVISKIAWERMVTAVAMVRERLQRVTEALSRAEIPYAVVGGHAVAAWVAEVDQAAVRNTPDVEILLARGDLDRVKEALTTVGLIYQHTSGGDLFLDGIHGKVRDAVHLIYAGEKVRQEKLFLAPSTDEVKIFSTIRVLALEPLLLLMLASHKSVDCVLVRDLIDVGLVDASWCARLPEELAKRLQHLLDTPEG